MTLSAEGGSDQIDATTSDDGTIDVTVSGTSEWTMTGTGDDVEGTLIVNGTGTAADGTEVDATLVVDTNGCN